MDPLSALVGGAANILGGLMNTSSQQSINTANIQQQQWSAEGGYLPGLVANAKVAGLNPLAVLGQRGPDMAVQVSGQPGAGLQAAGRSFADVNPHAEALAQLQEEKARIDIANARTAGNNAAIEGARNMWVLEQMQAYHAQHPDWAPEGLQSPTLVGSGADWLNNLNRQVSGAGAAVRGAASDFFSSRVPSSVWGRPWY